MKKDFNWGILGPGFIANKVLPDFFRAPGAKVLAVGSNTSGKARSFAEKWGIERWYESQDELLDDPDVDIVYITTPNAFHLENVVKALEKGKHVLCEKPFAMNARAARLMRESAVKNGVFLMEAMWTRFIPAVQKVKELTDAGEIGSVHNMVLDFSYAVEFDANYHLFDPKAGGGCLLDGGIYPLSFASYLYGNVPLEAAGFANIRNGVDVRDTVILRFSEGRMASFICGADTASPWDCIIYGSEGCIRLPSFYAAQEFTVEQYRTGEKKQVRIPFEGLGYQFEISEVMTCISQGKLESDVMPLTESAQLLVVMDDLRRQWNVRYPQDDF